MRLGLAATVLLGILFAPSIFADTATPPTSTTKVTFKMAKAECLKQDATLKGSALKKCIHEKRQVASTK